MPPADDAQPNAYLNRSAAELERCQQPWQIFRRGRNNYCVHLSGLASAPLVTIVDEVVVRVDLGTVWPVPVE